MAIAVLGDIHFASSKPYYVEVAEAFLRWFADWKENKAGNELILAGDVVHSSVNGGLVIDFVERMCKQSRFDRIHIVVGNHDVKFRDGANQLAYEFLRQKPFVSIYDRATVVDIQGEKVLMLPHYLPGPAEPLMRDAYSNAYRTFPDAYLLAVGHFMEESQAFGAGDAIVNLDKLNAKHIILGHLHIRANPEIYIGSVYANKSNENDSRRAAIIFENGLRREEKLPVFCEFLDVFYPNKLPPSGALVKVYTLYGCTSETLAKATYGSIHIRKHVQSLAGKEVNTTRSDAPKDLDVHQLFADFLKSSPVPIDRRVASICGASLKNATNLEYGNRNPVQTIL